MPKKETAFPRGELAKMAGITTSQLDYLVRLGIVVPDVGDKRKSFSKDEARLTVIAGALIPFFKDLPDLKEPLNWLRSFVTGWPFDDVPPSLDAMKAFYHEHQHVVIRENRKSEWPSGAPQHIFRMIQFEGACQDENNAFFQVAADEHGWRAGFDDKMLQLDDVAVWVSVDLRDLFRDIPELGAK